MSQDGARCLGDVGATPLGEAEAGDFEVDLDGEKANVGLARGLSRVDFEVWMISRSACAALYQCVDERNIPL